jgi:acyl transferase domain-containing protein/NAD(P)H-dependent flavin oxidoreductase YrpB (nitropropane dioxygenase family)
MRRVADANLRDVVVVADPCGRPNAKLVIAAARAGALGVLDLPSRHAGGPDGLDGPDGIGAVARRTTAPFAVRLRHGAARPRELDLPDQVDTVVLTGPVPEPTGRRRPSWAKAWGGRRVLVEVVSPAEARAALRAGCGGLIAKGCESGGRVGTVEGFVLAQQIADLLTDLGEASGGPGGEPGVPFWLQGGFGERTAAAAIAAGAAGVVLDGQLALVRESGLDDEARAAVESMDGSETRIVGGHRIYVRPDLPSASLAPDTPPDEVAGRLGCDLRRDLLPLGQDAASAARLARRYVTAGGAVQAVRAAIDGQVAGAAAGKPLAPGAGIARTHGIRYPVAQGPMTRVSDRAELAQSVAEAGGLPFLALALMTGPETRRLVTETAQLLGERPWGVGILGFVPPEVREAQLEVIHDLRPPVALIAGGRPSQARPLEDAGITTYLHVPSPGLLDRFLRDGARRFVFEGRECGGHVGPRASLPLWEAQVECLLGSDAAGEVDVLFAGGIHDARSAAMVAAVAAPLTDRGARVGVLMGTAYLFTREAVASGAITPTYQEVARDCATTVLLETSPGHATRCVETDYVRAFAARKAELEAAGVPAKEMWAELETLNLGRLRVASKGLTRQGNELADVDAETQRREGMYMIGQVAALRGELTTVAELHDDVTSGATARLDAVGADRAARSAPAVEVHEGGRAGPLDVAVVGMAGVFPGAADTEQYWANVVAGRDCVTEVPRDRWDPDTFYDPGAVTRDAGKRTPSKWGGFLPWIPFDALRYGIPPRSLGAIESVQLLSLEVVARALADAGYRERAFDRERTSVIFGAEGGNDLAGAYGFRAGYPHLLGPLPEPLDEYLPTPTEDSFPGVLVNVIAGRIANRLDLGGVNYTVDAACAASLAALDTACKELVEGTSDMVLCGGADVHNGINDYLMFASAHALSPSGRCRTFDAGADGIALGEGVACVVLKRLADAERDGDRIYGVIEAVAGSSDGRHLGLTAPRKEGQQRALRRAYGRAGVPAASVGLVEAHGTGTVVGDRTELETLTEVFAESGAAQGTAVLGSVKSQIGHTKCAAGLAGLVKALRAVHAGVLPPTINVRTPNAYYDPAASPFRFLDRPAPWPATERRAAVSAFGFGGTNFHVVLRSHADDDRPRHGVDVWPAELFLVRGDAGRVAELRRAVDRIVADDPGGERHRLRDLARTVSESGSGPVRWAIVAGDLPDLAAKLAAAEAGTGAAGVFAARTDLGGGQVAFLYPGQGSQRVGMLGDLFVAFPGLQGVLRGGERWAARIFPGQAFDEAGRAAHTRGLTDTRVAQPALGLAELAMTRLLRELGVEPDATGGHSYGELVALGAAGVFDETTLLELSEARGAAMVAATAALGDDPGAMAAVSLPADELRPRLPGNVVLANHNAPNQAVISGPTAAVEAVIAELEADRIGARRLDVAAAFHSPLVAEAADALADRLDVMEVGAPRLPVWSNATAGPYPEDPAGVRALAAAQVGRPVRFVEEVEAMYEAGVRTFVEAGPGRVLTGLAGRILGDRPHAAVACDVPGETGLPRLLLALAELAAAGVPVEVGPLFRGRAERLDLAGLPVAAPGWRLNGHLVCTRDGEPIPGGPQPRTRLPDVPEVTMHDRGPFRDTEPQPAAPAPAATNGRDAVLAEYLRAGQRMAEAQRDVMLSYLGGGSPAPAVDLPAAPPALVPVTGTAGTGVGDTGDALDAVGTAGGNGAGGNGSSDPPQPPAGNGRDGAAATPPAEAPRLSRDDLLAAVLAVVGERTGYPLDMLDPDLDLEADLSIDSIKRIEIVGELAERVGLPGVDPALGVDEAVVEELAKLKTLRTIVDWIDGHTDGPIDGPTGPSPEHDRSAPEASRAAPTAPASGADEGGPSADTMPVAVPPAARRHVVEWAPLMPALPVASLAGQCLAVVAPPGGAWDGLDELRHRLEAAGATVEIVVPQASDGDGDRPADRLPDEVAARLAAVDGIVDLRAADPGAAVDARLVFADLRPALSGRASTLVAATAPPADPSSTAVSGLAGLMRSLARELPGCHVRAVELPAGEQPAVVARLLADEVLDRTGPAAVTYRDGARVTRRAGAGTALDAAAPELPLDRESVVVLTGGARGITARAAAGLARATGCRLELIGRSPLPGDEDLRTQPAGDRAALRRTLAELGELSKPAEIEAACDRILAAREIRATLSTLREIGSPTEYHQADVRDADALARVLDQVRARHGRIDAVVHGAGVLDDRLARDKTDDGFDRVFATKVDAARALLTLAGDTSLVVFFGSVSGVFGNRGQVDYSAANDALDELARRLDGVAGRRVVSVDWGPWGGSGMVSPELEREYARRGVGLLDPDQGVAALLAEMASRPGDPAQVVVMRADPEALVPERPDPDRAAPAEPGPAPAPAPPSAAVTAEAPGGGLTLEALTEHA